ncbi:hypothetical protein F5Y04DRAFT_223321 [Hypomontagnella monticulosa]|nr:hypothetical protein F5Y04DRAFT_223321 [Hypomontagnella monticulosa]
MRSAPIAIGIYLLSSISTVFAKPASLATSVEIFERDGKTYIREAPHQGLDAEKRCNRCRGDGEQCTVGDGNCDTGSYCTWCGDHCKSICIPGGNTDKCTSFCL